MPSARIPAPPLLGGLSKVLWGPSHYVRQVSLPLPGLFRFSLQSACSPRLQGPHGQGAPGCRPPCRGRGLVPSALIFLVYLFIQLLGLKVLQTVRSATHDFIGGFHKPEQKPLSWLLPDNV